MRNLCSPRARGVWQRGQAAVETALVLPLNLFVILAIIQYGLIAQARLMAKYAAYRAVRVGVMNHADVQKMEDAATLTLLPVIALPWSVTNISGAEGYKPVNSAVKVGARLKEVQLLDQALAKISPQARTVNVVICGPTSGDFSGVTQADLSRNGATGSSNQVDFDDPRVTDYSGSLDTFDNYKKFMRTKLRIQLQFMYRMPIPFANWIMARAYLGMQLPDVMRMSTTADALSEIPKKTSQQAKIAYLALQKGVYVAPINVSYAMRMQSDFMLQQHPLPQDNQCQHYPSQGGATEE